MERILDDQPSPVRLAEVFRQLEERLVQASLAHFGDDLCGLLVYGSVGRGTMRANSDMDILLVVRGLPPTTWERLRLFDPVESELAPALADARRAGVETQFSPVLKSMEDLRKGFLLMLDMTEDARILWDRDRQLENSLEAFRQRLIQSGARRIRAGASGYWDLKPDYKPGDKVVI
jgi:predicted nucleotidyltransferase